MPDRLAQCHARVMPHAPAVWAFGVLALGLVAASPAWPEITPDHAARLEHLVVQDCGSCHGMSMKGGLGRPLTADALAHATPEGLVAIILDGIPGTAMPPWRPLLSEDEATWIAEYLLKDASK